MRKLEEIDGLIDLLLNHLASIQNEDGSFNTMFQNPHISNDWMQWSKENAPVDTATTLIPILNIHSKISSSIIAKGNSFLLRNSLDHKLWRFVTSSSTNLENPFDVDSSSQCSYVLNQSGYIIKNKNFLNQFINKDLNYQTYIQSGPYKGLSFITLLKLFYIHRNAPSIEQLKAADDDWEMGTTCNVLLYLGKMKNNQAVWSKLRKDFEDMNIKSVYYSLYFSIYAYARLYSYGKHYDLLPSQKKIDEIIYNLYTRLTPNQQSTDKLLLVNTMLLFEIDINKYSDMINDCFTSIIGKDYCEAKVYFTSHPKLDKHPEKSGPKTRFGSSGITCSLYLEFLNLYRKYFYGSYYAKL